MRKSLVILFAVLISSSIVSAQVINHWRGPNRDGIYPETGLLNVWPEAGPSLKWSFESLGKGYTSPTIVGNKLYITGLDGEEGYLHIFSLDGSLQKKIHYGKDVFTPTGYPGPRSSPLLDGNLCYLVTGFGKLICINLDTEKEAWSKEIFSDFDGKNVRFNFTENMLIDGEKIYISPGGVKNNVVALNKKTGELIWTSPGKGDLSAYCSPILITHNGKRMLINMMASNVIAVNPDDGKLLWSFPYKNQTSIHPNAPIYKDGQLYVFSGYGYGGRMLTINADGTGVTQAWQNTRADNQIGGAVLHNGYIYCSGDRNRKWCVVDWKTGETVFETNMLDKGTVIMAEGLLYAYTERGELALLQPEPAGLKLISKTTITKGSNEHWAHLVINNGTLYVRHGNALMAYNIKK